MTLKIAVYRIDVVDNGYPNSVTNLNHLNVQRIINYNSQLQLHSRNIFKFQCNRVITASGLDIVL